MIDRFEGDPQEVLDPIGSLPGTNPKPMRRHQMLRTVKGFEVDGRSRHSAQGATLWVVLEWCSVKRIPYSLTARPGAGYFVRRLE